MTTSQGPLDPDATDPLPPGATLRLGSRAFTHEWDHVRGLVHAGEVAFSVGGLGDLYAWSVPRGTRLRRLRADPTLEHHGSSGAGGLALSPDRSVVAVAGQRLTLWNTADLSSAGSFGAYHAGGHAIAFSPDGELLAVGASPAEGSSMALAVDLWRADGSERVARLPHGGGFRHVQDLAFSPDGSRLATVDESVLMVWEIGRDEPMLVEEWPGATSVAYFGDTLLVGTVRPGQRKAPGVPVRAVSVKKRLLRAATLEEVDLDLEGSNKARRLSLDPRGTRLAVGTWDGDIHVYDMDGRERLATCEERFGYDERLAWSPDGEVLLSGGYTVIRAWDPTTGERLDPETGTHRSGGVALAFSDSGQRMATLGEGGGLRLWQLEPEPTVEAAFDIPIVVSGERHRLSRVSWQGEDIALALDIRGIRAAGLSGAVMDLLKLQQDAHAVCLSPSGQQAGVALEGGVAVFDLNSLSVVHQVGVEGTIRALAASEEELFIGLAGALLRVRLEGPELVGRLDLGDQVALEQRGDRLFGQHADGRVAVMSLEPFEHLRHVGPSQRREDPLSTSSVPRMLVPAMAVSPDGTRVATSTGNQVWVWTAAAGKFAGCWDAPWDWTQHLAFSADGGRLAGIGSDGTALVWDVPA